MHARAEPVGTAGAWIAGKGKSIGAMGLRQKLLHETHAPVQPSLLSEDVRVSQEMTMAVDSQSPYHSLVPKKIEFKCDGSHGRRWSRLP
jgi:hypothetical protein